MPLQKYNELMLSAGMFIYGNYRSEAFGNVVVAIGGRKSDNHFFADHGMRYYSVDIREPKAFADFPDYRPQCSYIEQLLDFKKEMEEEPMAQLWGTKDDYQE